MMGETNLKACVLMSIFLLAFGCTTASARTIYVDDNGPSDFNTIQDAIDDSNDGDTIIVKPGIYLEYASFLGKNITVTSTNPDDYNVVGSTIIDHGVSFLGTEDANCTLTGFKINSLIYGGVNHTHAMISYCLLVDCYWVSDGTVIRGCDGTISNCVIVDNKSGEVAGYAISGCHGLIKDCTIANNELGVGILNGGTTTIENCIIYHNDSGQVGVASGATVDILYSNVEGGIYSGGDRTVNWGPGNIDADPCFTDTANWDYHLKSQADRWEPLSQSWVQDANTSPCIDAGNPHSSIGLEPFPNGGRVNMGAYGGTAEASKSYFHEPVCETIIAGDINGDCRINFLDFQIIALHWLRDEGQ